MFTWQNELCVFNENNVTIVLSTHSRRENKPSNILKALAPMTTGDRIFILESSSTVPQVLAKGKRAHLRKKYGAGFVSWSSLNYNKATQTLQRNFNRFHSI